MVCPQCRAAIAPGARFCAACGAPQDGAMGTVPLTIEQRNWLRANVVLPLVAVWGALGVMVLFFSCFFGGALVYTIGKVFAVVLALLAAGLLAATWLHVRGNLRDLRLGVAQVSTARLLSRTSTGHSPRSFYLELEGVGSVTVMADQYEGLVDGGLYRVTYSPHTRKGWTIEAE